MRRGWSFSLIRVQDRPFAKQHDVTPLGSLRRRPLSTEIRRRHRSPHSFPSSARVVCGDVESPQSGGGSGNGDDAEEEEEENKMRGTAALARACVLRRQVIGCAGTKHRVIFPFFSPLPSPTSIYFPALRSAVYFPHSLSANGAFFVRPLAAMAASLVVG